MLNYRLNRKQNLKKKKKDTIDPETQASAEVWGEKEKKKTGHHVLPINTNTTFNSTASVLSCTATHRHNVLHAHTLHLIADNTTTICCHIKSFRGVVSNIWKKKKISWYYIYIYIYLFIHILIYKNKTVIKSIESQMYWSSVDGG